MVNKNTLKRTWSHKGTLFYSLNWYLIIKIVSQILWNLTCIQIPNKFIRKWMICTSTDKPNSNLKISKNKSRTPFTEKREKTFWRILTWIWSLSNKVRQYDKKIHFNPVSSFLKILTLSDKNDDKQLLNHINNTLGLNKLNIKHLILSFFIFNSLEIKINL